MFKFAEFVKVPVSSVIRAVFDGELIMSSLMSYRYLGAGTNAGFFPIVNCYLSVREDMVGSQCTKRL